jgi:hypothetical protein
MSIPAGPCHEFGSQWQWIQGNMILTALGEWRRGESSRKNASKRQTSINRGGARGESEVRSLNFHSNKKIYIAK